jgi:hypothetical protein
MSIRKKGWEALTQRAFRFFHVQIANPMDSNSDNEHKANAMARTQMSKAFPFVSTAILYGFDSQPDPHGVE